MSGAIALVLGATGVIGRAAAAALQRAGFQVRGLARKPGSVTRADDSVEWVFADLVALTDAQAWRPIVADAAVIVNAAGALQDGLEDRLNAVHGEAIAALATAAAGAAVRRIVHISAPGVSAAASTGFYRTKALGDDVVRGSGLHWVILRPALVVAPDAYGGTALLRALAVFPGAIPVFLPEARMQTVAIDDVSGAIVRAALGHLPSGTDVALAEAEAHSLADILVAFRRWLGLADAPIRRSPAFLAKLIGLAADAAGRLGWRSPMRSTALTVTGEGVTADASVWEALSGSPCRPLAATLAGMPATHQERWFARLYLLKPVIIVSLALFWVVSGLVGVVMFDAAAMVLTARGVSEGLAGTAVAAGSVIDIGLGLAALWRPWARTAFGGMAAVTAAYVLGGTIFAPDLWADPLGPLAKALPAFVLALVARALMAER